MKIIILVFLTAITFGCSTKQKLPSIQKTSLRAPASVRVDGKLDEWGQLKAYNKSTYIYYTISNDDTNLYLAVRVVDTLTIKKILAGGVTVSINKSAKRDADSDIAVTYPVYEGKQYMPKLIFASALFSKNPGERQTIQADSLVAINNLLLSKSLKLISVAGIGSIDKVISVYNETGIKASSLSDSKMMFNVELAIPLKLLQPNISSANHFSYSIRLKGNSNPNMSLASPTGRSDLLTFTANDGKEYMIGKATPENFMLYTATDFSGEYTLAR